MMTKPTYLWQKCLVSLITFGLVAPLLQMALAFSDAVIIIAFITVGIYFLKAVFE